MQFIRGRQGRSFGTTALQARHAWHPERMDIGCVDRPAQASLPQVDGFLRSRREAVREDRRRPARVYSAIAPLKTFVRSQSSLLLTRVCTKVRHRWPASTFSAWLPKASHHTRPRECSSTARNQCDDPQPSGSAPTSASSVVRARRKPRPNARSDVRLCGLSGLKSRPSIWVKVFSLPVAPAGPSFRLGDEEGREVHACAAHMPPPDGSAPFRRRCQPRAHRKPHQVPGV